MPVKPGSNNWNDLKMATAALAAATTLGLWNLFAAIDKPATMQIIASLPTPSTVVADPAQPTFHGKILLGGQAPSQQIIVIQSPRLKNSQQPAPVTQTRSS